MRDAAIQKRITQFAIERRCRADAAPDYEDAANIATSSGISVLPNTRDQIWRRHAGQRLLPIATNSQRDE